MPQNLYGLVEAALYRDIMSLRPVELGYNRGMVNNLVDIPVRFLRAGVIVILQTGERVF